MRIIVYIIFGIMLFSMLFFWNINQTKNVTSNAIQSNVITSLHLEPEYINPSPGQVLIAQVTLFQLGNAERKDVRALYFLQNTAGEAIPLGEQTVALESQSSFILSATLSASLTPGSYTLNVEIQDVKTEEVISSASQRIFLKKVRFLDTSDSSEGYFVLLGLTLFILAVFTILFYLQNKKIRRLEHREW